MKNLIYRFLLISFTVILHNGCTKDIVEINPNEIAKNNFWRDLSETQVGLNAVYQTLHNPAVLNIIEEALRSDMAWPGYGRPVPQNTEPFYNQTYTASNDEINDKWQTNYQGIFRANQVIEALNNLDESEKDKAEWTSQMAQARFFRGLFHYYLYITYNEGNIIIRDFVPQSSEDFNLPLSPAEEVLEFVRNDLQYAYENLYAKGEYPENDASKVTSGAAATILGTTYLNELEYNTAMEYFNAVINSGKYSLVYDMDLLFTTAGEFNDESIFEINFTEDFIEIDDNRFNGDSGTNWLNQQTSGTRGATVSAWIAYAYKSEPMDPQDPRNYYRDPVSNETKLRNVPLRASAMVGLVDDNQTTFYLEGTASEYPRFGAPDWGIGWYKKYTNHDIVTRENQLPNGIATLSSKNVVINRYAEVLLMQAECKIKTGSIQEALDLINQIRARWGLVLLGNPNGDFSHTYDEEEYTEESLMEHLMDVEKPLELSIEGHAIRFIDYQRWERSEGEGFKDRLEELANREYYGVHYTFYSQQREANWTRFRFPSVVADQPENGPYFVFDFEYDIPALNYNEEENGSYPIPTSEVNANPNINFN